MSTTGTMPIESKSAKKRKAKADAAAVNGGETTPTAEASAPATETHPTTNGADSLAESPVVKELHKNLRNLNKKISATAKADTVVAENPGISIDDLVSQKKLNADQKAQLLKKPGLQAQVTQLEEQLTQFRTFAHELEEKAVKEKSALLESNEAEIAKVKAEAAEEAEQTKLKAVEDGLHVVIQFLHAAASKRQVEDAESDEARAFEGALLLVYQGNETALSTLKDLIYGTDSKVTDVEGQPLDFTFAQIKESSLQSAQASAPSVAAEGEDDVAVPAEEPPSDMASDSTVAHAGLTELDDASAIQAEASNTETAADSSIIAVVPEQTSTGEEAANAVAEGWDPQASMVTDTSANNDEWVQVPRDPAETDTGLTATPAAAAQTSNSWAEEVGAAVTNAEEKPATENDGFEQVRRERGRGRGGNGRGGRGDFRGRGRGGRDGNRGGRGRDRERDGQGNGGRGRGARAENKN